MTLGGLPFATGGAAGAAEAERGVEPGTVLANAPVVLYVYDVASGRSTFQNRPLGELLGYSRQEAAAFGADEWRILVHPDDQTRFPVHRERLGSLAPGESCTFEYRMLHADGSWHWILSRDLAMEADGPTPGMIVGSASDVTEQKRAEHLLRDSEHRLRLAMDAASMGMWEWDVVTPRVTWSPECYEILGLEVGAFDGTTDSFDAMLHPDDRDRQRQTVRAALAEGTRYECEYRIVRPDGSVRWVENLGHGVYDDLGRPLRMVGTLTDVTARKDAEEALVASQGRLASVLDNMDQGFCVLEMIRDADDRPVDYRFLEVNPTFEQHTGLRDAVGHTAKELVPDLEQHWLDTYDEVARTREARRFHQGSLAMGRSFDVEALPVGPEADGQVALLFRDVTERERADAALRDALRVKDEFLGLVSHELRTPMTVILGMSRLLARSTLDRQQAREVAEDIAASAEVLNELVEAMLMLARLDQSEATQLHEPILLHRVAGDVLARMADRLPHCLLGLDVRDTAIVEVQRTWVERVIENFVVNAAKYGGAGTSIQVVVEREGRMAKVRVVDDGPGLGDDADRLFEPFYRSSTVRDGAPGVGLGLAVADRIVTLMGGRIWGRNNPDRGAEFGFTLPLTQEDQS
jgi:PAS domain S-box-containing protein